MAPFKSSAGRQLGKLLEGYKSSDIGKGFGSGGGGGGGFVASGGNVSDDVSAGRRFHVYNSSPGAPQPFTVSLGARNAYFILVAGGGSGCGGYGGGGGGGGVAYSESFPLEPGEYVAVIGAGGAAPPAAHGSGNTGSDSTFTIGSSGLMITAKGGGGGGLGSNAGSAGGSAGGGGSNTPVGQQNQLSQNPNIPYITNYGSNGGSAPSTSPGWTHGGGGGAGEVGESSSSNTACGRGGAGLGPPTWSWLPTSYGHNGYFAGGGGGSGYSTNSSNGAGSPDGTGGAAGVIGNSQTPGVSGVANTGGGGGGAGTPGPGQPYNTAGGAGAGGALIIAYDI